MKTPANLTKADLAQIEQAVKTAESSISGEIVPVLLQRSHHYPSSKYKLAFLLSIASFIALIAMDRLLPNFDIYDPIYYFTIVYSFAIIGFILPVWFPVLAVSFASAKEKEHATTQRAETVFLENEIFNTKQRSGIMLFISFEEHQAIVMADSGISKKVDQKEWDDLVSALIAKVKEKKIVEGISNAIKTCETILIDNGFRREAGDNNELSDQLITD